MKKSIRLVALISIFGLSGLSMSTGINAVVYPNCSTMSGQSCSPAGQHAACWDNYTREPTGCVCKSTTLTWHCFTPY